MIAGSMVYYSIWLFGIHLIIHYSLEIPLAYAYYKKGFYAS